MGAPTDLMAERVIEQVTIPSDQFGASAGVDAWRSLGRYAGALERAAAVVMIVAGLGQVALSLVVLDVV